MFRLMPFYYMTFPTLCNPATYRAVLGEKANVSLDFLNKSVLEEEKKQSENPTLVYHEFNTISIFSLFGRHALSFLLLQRN